MKGQQDSTNTPVPEASDKMEARDENAAAHSSETSPETQTDANELPHGRLGSAPDESEYVSPDTAAQQSAVESVWQGREGLDELKKIVEELPLEADSAPSSTDTPLPPESPPPPIKTT